MLLGGTRIVHVMCRVPANRSFGKNKESVIASVHDCRILRAVESLIYRQDFLFLPGIGNRPGRLPGELVKQVQLGDVDRVDEGIGPFNGIADKQ